MNADKADTGEPRLWAWGWLFQESGKFWTAWRLPARFRLRELVLD